MSEGFFFSPHPPPPRSPHPTSTQFFAQPRFFTRLFDLRLEKERETAVTQASKCQMCDFIQARVSLTFSVPGSKLFSQANYFHRNYNTTNVISQDSVEFNSVCNHTTDKQNRTTSQLANLLCVQLLN